MIAPGGSAFYVRIVSPASALIHRKGTDVRIRQLATCSIMALLVFLAPAATKAQGKTAQQFYQGYVAAFAKAKTIDDILPFMAAENRKQAEATPKAERDKMFEMIKMFGHTDIKVLKEEKGADGSTVLSVEGVDSDKKKSTGQVTIVKEGTAWKIGKESWTTKS
jgi:hypothetical protein